MKKVLLAFVVLLTSFSLVACSNDEDVIKVGMDLKWEPFLGLDNSGNPSGIEVDIAEAFSEYIGQEIEIVNMDFGMLIPALQKGDIDIIISSMSYSDERAQSIDFSEPYFTENVVSLVNIDYANENNLTSESLISEVLEVENTAFVGVTGTLSSSLPDELGFETSMVTSNAVAVSEITSGKSDIHIGTYQIYGMHDANKDTTILIDDPINISKTCMAVQQGDSELLDKANDFIAQMESSGLNDQLRTDWNEKIAESLASDRFDLDYYLPETDNE